MSAFGELVCDCTGTLRVGKRCDISYIQVEPIEPLFVNATHEVIIKSSLPNDKEVSIIASEATKLISEPQTITLLESSRQSSTNYKLEAKYPGIYQVRYDVNPDSNNILIPEDSIVIASETDLPVRKDYYFERLGLGNGILGPGCCSHVVSKAGSECLSDLMFSSSCEWVPLVGGSQVSSKGVVFVRSHTINLPLSIAGLSISNASSSTQYFLPFDSSVVTKQCVSCSKQQTSKCLSTGSSVNFDVYDTGMFLSSNSLIKTTLSKISHLLPPWLSINVWLTGGTPSYSSYDFWSALVNGNDLNDYPNCAMPLDNRDNKDLLYYLLRTRVPLHILIDSFNTFLYSSSLNPQCMVIDMCGTGLKVYLTIPSDLQPSKLTNLKYFERLLSNGASLELTTFVMAEKGIEVDQDDEYWTGTEYIQPLLSAYEFEVGAKLDKIFTGGDLKVHYTFEGTAFHSSKVDDRRKV